MKSLAKHLLNFPRDSPGGSFLEGCMKEGHDAFCVRSTSDAEHGLWSQLDFIFIYIKTISIPIL